MRYLVAIPITNQWASVLGNIQAEAQPASWHRTMEPHITLLAPDRIILPPRDAAAAFNSLNLGIKAFTIQTSSKVERFSRNQHHTLVLKPEPRRQLTRLYRILIRASIWQSTTASLKRPYEPHITLANQLSNESASIAASKLEKFNLDVSFLCSKIALFSKEASWPHWQELATHDLAHRQADSLG